MGVRITRKEFESVYNRLHQASNDVFNQVHFDNLYIGTLYAAASNGVVLAVTKVEKHRSNTWGRVSAGYSLELCKQVLSEVQTPQSILELHDEGISTSKKDYKRVETKRRLNWWPKFADYIDDISGREKKRNAWSLVETRKLEAAIKTIDTESIALRIPANQSSFTINDQEVSTLSNSSNHLNCRVQFDRFKLATELLHHGSKIEMAFYQSSRSVIAMWHSKLIVLVLCEAQQ